MGATYMSTNTDTQHAIFVDITRQVKEETWNHITINIWIIVWNNTWDQVREHTWGTSWSHIWDQAWSQLYTLPVLVQNEIPGKIVREK